MDDPIIIEFDGRKYAVPESAVDFNRIMLPDGRVIAADRWGGRNWRIPIGLHLAIRQDIRTDCVAAELLPNEGTPP